MKYPPEYSKYIAMRKTADLSASSGTAWDGQQRRASDHHADQRFAKKPYVALDTKAVFREMIVHEIKNGKLSPWRRKRIVRYAAKLGLSAVQAGQLLAECRKQAITELESHKESPMLRLHTPETSHHPWTARILLGLAIAVLLNVAAILLLP